MKPCLNLPREVRVNTEENVLVDVILRKLSNRIDELKAEHLGEVITLKLITKLDNAINDTLAEILRYHVESCLTRKHLLVDRAPRFDVVLDGNCVNFDANRDLNDILNLLKGE